MKSGREREREDKGIRRKKRDQFVKRIISYKRIQNSRPDSSAPKNMQIIKKGIVVLY